MSAGDSLNFFTPQHNNAPSWFWVAFTSGSTEPSLMDTIWGDASNANAVLEYITLTSGTWGGGDAAGYMLLSNHDGTAWTSGENFTANTTVAGNHGTITSTPGLATATGDVIRSDTMVVDFPSSAPNTLALFPFQMPYHYGGGGITLTVGVVSSTATGDMSFAAFMKSLTDDVDNLGNLGTDPSGLKAFAPPVFNQTIDAATVAGEVKYFEIAMTDGAQMDSIAAGEYGQLLLMRDSQDGTNDDMAQDAEFVFMAMRETLP